MLRNTFHFRHILDAINERSLYLVPYRATNFSNNAATSIDLAIVDLAINLVYKFVADKTSNKIVTYRDFRNCHKKRCLKILLVRYHVILL